VTYRKPKNLFDADIVLAAYKSGFFPMAESKTGPISWFSPDPRAIIPLTSFNVPRSLRRALKNPDHSVTINQAFPAVIRACAERGDDDATWISDEVIQVYTELHRRGVAHSVETWMDGHLEGGLYGVAIGAAFFGESMFSKSTNASKFALVHLVERLRKRNFQLLDTQIINDHVRQFGAIEIPRSRYLSLLSRAISQSADFFGNS
jgi:leucyl/phenylalanyl-tRNA--protein transferase